MTEFIDVEGRWNASLSAGEASRSLTLYSLREPLNLRGEFLQLLRKLLEENEHYVAGDILKALTSPEGEDMMNLAFFLLIIVFEDAAARAYGSPQSFLFGEMEDGTVSLMASSDREMTENLFFKILGTVIERPDLVKTLLIAYAP
ncbi:hypothetical protein CW701_01505 [Candidatus Bathyarchaeota archaeon]|nr:MAG: hypothetical protein CW701_01505 [Candidatus Bathyarchaeota archaeon]RLI19226.1 MAG: hypothetical protein DRO49_00925 [Candidatus Bathyarchaeota archaeon]